MGSTITLLSLATLGGLNFSMGQSGESFFDNHQSIFKECEFFEVDFNFDLVFNDADIGFNTSVTFFNFGESGFNFGEPILYR